MMTGLTLTQFISRSNLVAYAFVWEKVEIVIFYYYYYYFSVFFFFFFFLLFFLFFYIYIFFIYFIFWGELLLPVNLNFVFAIN